MAIQCRNLFEIWSNGKGAGYGNGRLETMFVSACNMVLSDISFDADLATNHSPINTIDDSISTLDDDYVGLMVAGIEYFGTFIGVRPADPKIATVVFDQSEKLYERLKGQYMRSIDNSNQPTQNTTMEDIGYLDV